MGVLRPRSIANKGKNEIINQGTEKKKLQQHDRNNMMIEKNYSLGNGR